jgi:hypothetical protein
VTTPPSILSIDIDLNRYHAWSSKSGRVAYNAVPFEDDAENTKIAEALGQHDVVLVEVASNTHYIKKMAIVHRVSAWMIFNTYLAAQFYDLWDAGVTADTPRKFLVSPSDKWTKGYREEVRQAMAGVAGEDNHDIREARTMQFFYLMHPTAWVPFHTYYNSFSFKKTKGTK